MQKTRGRNPSVNLVDVASQIIQSLEERIAYFLMSIHDTHTTSTSILLSSYRILFQNKTIPVEEGRNRRLGCTFLVHAIIITYPIYT
jgi:hypothetical protein